MNMRSHLALAVYLSERLDLRSFAFIFGNVQPDLAVYSYLKGSTSGRKAHGHDYRNMLPRIVSVLSKLEQGKGEGGDGVALPAKEGPQQHQNQQGE